MNTALTPADPVMRCVCEARAHAGSVQTLPEAAWPLPQPPAGVSAATAALLTRLDPAAMLWIAPRLLQSALTERLPFGLRLDEQHIPAHADVALAPAADTDAALWRHLQSVCRDNRPLTLIIEVPGLLANPAPPRHEPGDMELAPQLCVQPADHSAPRHLGVAGISRHFWRQRIEAVAQSGIELVLCCGSRLSVLTPECGLSLRH